MLRANASGIRRKRQPHRGSHARTLLPQAENPERHYTGRMTNHLSASRIANAQRLRKGICDMIIGESHNGRLWATADSGCGATFHFALPTALEAFA